MDIDFKIKAGFVRQLVYIVILPSFYLGSALLYNQFDIQGYYTFGSYSSDFHLVITSCIIMVCTAVTRAVLRAVSRKNALQWWHYCIWCIGEMFVMSAFISLYNLLFKGAPGGYFGVLPTEFKFIYLTLCYPYIFLMMAKALKIQEEELTRRSEAPDNSLVRFYDEHKRLKLSISHSSILYVKSELNYVKIHYLDGGRVKEFMLRASMKSLESVANSRYLVRCQRSYFVNPEHVTVLRKDSEGFIYAEMNIPDVPAVPVGKLFYDSLSSLL